jgi:hypothetical protein
MVGLGTIQLSETSEIVFYTDTFRSELFANIRKFIKSRKYTGPTQSGIALTVEQLRAIFNRLIEFVPDFDTLSEQELITISTGTTKHIVVKIQLFNGVYRLDIRQYISTDKYKGPLKKGVSIPISYWDDIITFCREMLSALEANERSTALFDEAKSEPTSTENKIEKVEGVPDGFQKFFE